MLLIDRLRTFVQIRIFVNPSSPKESHIERQARNKLKMHSSLIIHTIYNTHLLELVRSKLIINTRRVKQNLSSSLSYNKYYTRRFCRFLHITMNLAILNFLQTYENPQSDNCSLTVLCISSDRARRLVQKIELFTKK